VILVSHHSAVRVLPRRQTSHSGGLHGILIHKTSPGRLFLYMLQGELRFSIVSLRERMPLKLPSIVEVNVGLICLCLPVVSAPLLNRITNLGRSLRSWLSSRRSHRSHPSNQDSGSSDHDDSVPALPSVPGGTMTGVRSLFRSFNRSENHRSRNEDSPRDATGVGSFSDMESADFSYHNHLKGAQNAQRTIHE
jgi:hypothetical protein